MSNAAEIFRERKKYEDRLTSSFARAAKYTQANLRRAANDNEPPGLEVIDIADWQGRPVEARQWWLEGLIPAPNVTLLSGDGGLGKSLVALQFGIASTIGRGALGLTPQAGRVFYLAAEDEADEFHRRADDILRHYDATFADTGGHFMLAPLAAMDATLMAPGAGGNMKPTPLLQHLIDQITEFEPDLVVLDTAADLFGGDEIKRAQVRQFIAMLRQIAMAQDCAILLLAHPSVAGMTSGTGTSGSTAWNNSVRSRLYLDTPATERSEVVDPDARRLGQKKSNYGPRDAELRFRWQDGVFVTDSGGVNPAAGLMNIQADKVFLELLKKLTRQLQNLSPNKGPTYAPALMARQPEAKGIKASALAAAMQRLLDAETIKIVEEGPASKRRQRLILSEADFGPSN